MSRSRLVVCLVLFLGFISAAVAEAAPLLRPLASDKAVGLQGLAVTRAQAVAVDLRAFYDSMDRSLSNGTLELELFWDASMRAVLDQIRFETAKTVSWIGHIEGIEGSQAIFVAGGGVVVGSITLPGTAFRLRFSPEKMHVIEEVDANAFPLETLPIEVHAPADGGPQIVERSRLATRDNGSRFDLLVVYNAAARQAAGGTTAMQNLITLGVTETNQAYANSGITPRLRLVHMQEITYRETGGISTTLSRLQNPGDGRMDEVHGLRNQYGADLVKFVGNSTSGGCGVAYLMAGSNNTAFESSAFSVTARACISPNYTFGHELGHNMGCNHAPGDPTGTGAFSYSFGYKNPSSVFRTVMAYDCSPSCPRVLQFSNPNVTYQGLVTGTATQNNATSINNVANVVANFRQEVVP